MALVKHKQALDEIFEAEMVSGGALDMVVDRIITSPVGKLPSDAETFILLANWTATDVRVGFMKVKYRLINQEVIVGAVKKDDPAAEDVAEYNCYEASKKVRTLLVNNRKLISPSYPSGIAIETEISNSRFEYEIYEEILCCFDVMYVEIKLIEDA